MHDIILTAVMSSEMTLTEDISMAVTLFKNDYVSLWFLYIKHRC